jgi:4a-hydroxytetrahydrobiopterin dehydratase
MSESTETTETSGTTDPKQVLRYPQVVAAGLDDWRYFLNGLHARFRTGSFTKGLELVTRITDAAEAADHHPDVTLTYPQVDVDLSSHDVGGVTSRDLDLAREISAIAADLGLEPAPAETSRLELALDVPDAEEVRPFWAAVLGYEATEGDPEVRDPGGRNNTLWFQTAPGATGEQPQRFHLDIVVAREAAEARVQAAVDAGGRLVTDEYAPAFWVLADAHGNQVCVCTADGREPGEARWADA